MFKVGDRVEVTKKGLLSYGWRGVITAVKSPAHDGNPLKVTFDNGRLIGFGHRSTSLMVIERAEEPVKIPQTFREGQTVLYSAGTGHKVYKCEVKQVQGKGYFLQRIKTGFFFWSSPENLEPPLPEKNFFEAPVVEYQKQVFFKGQWVEATTRNGQVIIGKVKERLVDGAYKVAHPVGDYLKNTSKFWPDQLKVADVVPEKVGVKSGAGGYILWNPKSNLAPKVIHETYEQAKAVAIEMAELHNVEFKICLLVASTSKEIDDDWQA